jgi:uroporphyrinogen decarboxylase
MSFNDTFLKACRKEPTAHTPVWYMRQAGRYDPEYREIKKSYSLLEICRQPELAAEITLMPIHKLGVDAAILYSDIMNPVASIGIDFDIVANVGPVIDNPIRSKADIERLRPINVEGDLAHVLETIRILRRELKVPLITFVGAPFTLASYLIEGKPSRNYLRTKQMMFSDPDAWFLLMDKLGDMLITYLKAQIESGAQAIQVFDSWVGALAPEHFRYYVFPTIERIFSALNQAGVPRIYFPGVSSGELFPLLGKLDAEVIGVDWRLPLPTARERLGSHFAVQGNLDPMLLTAPQEVIEAEARKIIEQGLTSRGHIFNLGHGLFPEASLDKLKDLTSFIHSYSRQIIAKQTL